MGRPRKIINETVGRLTESMKTDLTRRKKLTLHQKQKILDFCNARELKDLGYQRKCDQIFCKFDLKISKSALRTILKHKESILPVKTCENSSRTGKISPLYNSFRDTIHAETQVTVMSNDLLKTFAKKVQEREIYKNDKFIQSLKFSNNWIWSFKKDYNL